MLPPTVLNSLIASDALVLDPKHPGINDTAYIARRVELFNLAMDYRLAHKGIPDVLHTVAEHAIWQAIANKLNQAHEQYAADFYLTGKQQLAIDSLQMPALTDLDDKLSRLANFNLIPAEGLLHPRIFFAYLSKGILPCTHYLRHGSMPEYTPEPDAVHDIIGHIPPLMDAEFAEIITLVGQGVVLADDDKLLAWERLYWFSIEFGLIQQGPNLKAYGAGLLSSFGELYYAFSEDVTRKPFDLAEVINTSYDPTQMQRLLFVIPSLSALKIAVQQLIAQ